MVLSDYYPTGAHLLDSKTLKMCDIIEFNRGIYSHYGFYIGNKICIHVKAPTGFCASFSFSTSCKPKSRTGMKCAELLTTISGGYPCRVDNQCMVSYLRDYSRRGENYAVELATKKLPRDKNGNLILGKGVKVVYGLLSNNNCEGWATYWRYNSFGWSHQAVNGGISSTFGTLERLFEGAVAGCEAIVKEDSNRLRIFGAAVGAVSYKTLSLGMKAVTKTTDLFTGFFL